jgi:hypothetical protein
MSASRERQPPFAFICYGHVNQEYVTLLVDHLTNRGIPTWHDADIPTGDRWDLVLRHRIVAAGAVIVVMSSAAKDRDWVRKEILKAKAENKKIIPLLLDGEAYPLLAHLHYTKVRDGAMPGRKWIGDLRAGLAAQAPPKPRRWLAAAGLAACLSAVSGAAWVALDREAPDPRPSALPQPAVQSQPVDNACDGLPTRIEEVSEESPGHTGLRPTITVRTCATAGAGHEYWLMDFRVDHEGAGSSRVFYAKVHVDGPAGSERGYRIEHGPGTEAGSQRWYVVVDVPPSLTDEVRRSRDDDYGRQIGRDEKAPPAMAIVSNERPGRR